MTLGFESAMTSMMEEAAESVIEAIAAEGLVALKSVLDASGFADSEHLKDYEVIANVMRGSVEYEIIVKLEALASTATESLREGERVQKPTRESPRAAYMKRISEIASAGEARELVKTYALTKHGKPLRLDGPHDARKPSKDARRHQRDARTGSDRRAKPEARKGSGARLLEHTMAAYAPRGMDVDDDGIIRIAFQREVRTTGKSFIMPQGSYQGIVKDFVDKIRALVENEFTAQFDQILERSMA